MAAYAVVRMDLSTGSRAQLPDRFGSQEEAMARVAELSLADPGVTYLVQLVPLG